jgi:hypothetical protein
LDFYGLLAEPQIQGGVTLFCQGATTCTSKPQTLRVRWLTLVSAADGSAKRDGLFVKSGRILHSI